MINKILKGWYHAKYHRYLKKAESAKEEKNIHKFKEYVYQAEDSWKRIIILTNKNKK